MKIDNRYLLPFVVPFALLITVRGLWFFAGAKWSQPEAAAMSCLVFGGTLGVCLSAIFFCDGKEIGHVTIGKEEL